MENSQKKLIMLVGKTHSGKTTFAEELHARNQDLIILEADPIAVFMKEKFPILREYDDKEHSGAFKQVSLKFRTFLSFVEFSLSLGKPIILSNSNMWSEGRKMVFEMCKKFNYQTIGVYFDLPEEMIMDRIHNSKRSVDVLRLSKDFKDLISKQNDRMQVPDGSEFDKFFLIKLESDIKHVEETLIQELCN